jgi:NADPH:quinone reductase-like Zn-dependent oxidoreductase
MRWEYKVVVDQPGGTTAEQLLNQMGRDGWELVSVVAVQREGATNGVYFFKRPER